MEKTIAKNDLFLDIEASQFLSGNGEKLVRISHQQCITEKGPQSIMRVHTRITEGDNTGYIATSESIWPRAFATEADLDLLRKSVIKDLMLRFGWGKKVMVTGEDGKQHEEETWGTPKWVAWFDGKDWHELQGAKVPFDGASDASDPADADSDDDPDTE